MSIDLAYAELGLAPGASESEVRAAWRRLVSRWHPDRNKSADAVDLMQRINSAYERIKAFTRSAPPGSSDSPSSATESAPVRPQGRVLRRRVKLSLEEAALGCTKILRGKLTESCTTCNGDGVLAHQTTCTGCQGAGTVRGPAWFGWMPTQSVCKACQGRGRLRPVCHTCEGTGKCTTAYRRTVRIPAGVRHGDVLSAQAVEGTPGDFEGTLEMNVEVSPHTFFMVGDDGCLRCEMPVDGFAWIANAWVDVPTLTGVQQMRLQRGRHVYRLRGQGLPLERQGAARGDYIVTVEPTFPDEIGPEQEARLGRLAQLSCTRSTAAWQRKLRAWERNRPA